MKETITAKRYASSLYELGQEKSISIADELIKLTEVINSSNDLENVLFLDVFTMEEKSNVFNEVAKKINLSPLTIMSVNYLIQEKRIQLLPLIIKEIVVIDDHKKGFIRGVIEGSDEHENVEFSKKIKVYLKNKLGKEPELSYVKNENISAGYKVTVEDVQFDASIDNQLEKFKQSIIG
jgi:F-type H+-transporting ATPase subunit delta